MRAMHSAGSIWLGTDNGARCSEVCLRAELAASCAVSDFLVLFVAHAYRCFSRFSINSMVLESSSTSDSY